ncbi:hypothetical protein D9M70_625100 [compost metagenome]
MAAADDVAAPTEHAVLDVAAALDDRHHCIDMRQASEGIGIAQAQRAHAAEDAAQPAGLGLARMHGDDPRAELREVVQHIDPHALADGREQGHRSDADRHPEQGQQAAQRPADQGRGGELQAILPAHHGR